MNDAQDWAELLRWYAEMGVDEAIGEVPVDRTQPRPPQSAAQPAMPAAPRHAAPSVPASRPMPAAVAAPDIIAIANTAATLDALARAVAEFEGCALRRTATNTVFAD